MRYLINDDDLDEIMKYLYKQNKDYLLDKLLVQVYENLEYGRKCMNELYGEDKIIRKGNQNDTK